MPDASLADQLIAAVRAKDVARVRELIAAGASVHEPRTLALRAAAHLGALPVVRALLEAGADANQRDASQLTALFGVKDAKTLQVLLDAGADVRVRTPNGSTPLHSARTAAIVELLLSRGADPNAVTDGELETPLHKAAAAADDKIVAALLRAQPDLERRDRNDSTALMSAVFGKTARYLATTKLLLAAGAQVNAARSDGTTALRCAARDGSPEILGALLTAGAQVNAADSDGETALTDAARASRAEIVRRLLAAGADPEARISARHGDPARRGKSARDLGSACRSQEVRALLAG